MTLKTLVLTSLWIQACKPFIGLRPGLCWATDADKINLAQIASALNSMRLGKIYGGLAI